MSEDSIETKSVPRFIVDQKSLTGFEKPESSAFQLVREVIENSFDSCERAKILPEIVLIVRMISQYIWEVMAIDNGLGLADSDIPKAFGSVLTSSKYNNRQDRGMFGLGVKNVLLVSQITTNEPFAVVSSKFSRAGKIFPKSTYYLKINLDTNQPEVKSHKVEPNKKNFHGLGLKFKIGRVDFESAKNNILTYLALTHAICPYAYIKFVFNDEVNEYKRKINLVPLAPRSTLFHPYDVELLDLEDLINRSKKGTTLVQFLKKSFQRVGSKIAADFCKFAKLDVNKEVKGMTHNEIYKLKETMDKFDKWKPPSTVSLSLIEEDCFKEGVKELSPVEFFSYTSRKGVFSGSAFAIEVCVVSTGSKTKTSDKKDTDNITVRRIVNKIPLIDDYRSCLLRNVFNDISFSYYKIDTSKIDLVFYVHLCSSSKRALFKDLTKGIIADIPEIRKTLDLSLKDVLRKVSDFVSHRERIEYEKRKQSRFSIYIPIMARDIAFLTNESVSDVENILKNSLLEQNV